MDTGKTFTASLEASFVEEHKLAEGVELTMAENRRLEGTASALDEVIGREFLKGLVVTLDYPNTRISLWPW